METKPEAREAKETKESTIMGKVASFATISAILTSFIALAILAVAAVVITAAVSAPLLLFLSPILLPLGTFVIIVTAGVLGVGGATLGTLIVISWLQGYRKGRPVVGAEKVEAVKRTLVGTVGAAKERAAETVQVAREKVPEAKEKLVETKEKAKEEAPSQERQGAPAPPAQESPRGGRGRA
ncbi:hypothetical protein KP509_22G030700 [Ceratopteris richardii]|uniref:Oleosin n=1 Tax=Ceratopteris richardii TaxID=49495 RepID=A0A8T2S708_CERRI|nr:hypothetical protein KP509_22G030700 [Ceratopteris richardii]